MQLQDRNNPNKTYLPTKGFQKRNDATENGPRELAMLQAGFLLYIRARIIAKVSVQGVVALGGHFATLCQEVDFYEAMFFFRY